MAFQLTHFLASPFIFAYLELTLLSVLYNASVLAPCYLKQILAVLTINCLLTHAIIIFLATVLMTLSSLILFSPLVYDWPLLVASAPPLQFSLFILPLGISTLSMWMSLEVVTTHLVQPMLFMPSNIFSTCLAYKFLLRKFVCHPPQWVSGHLIWHNSHDPVYPIG